MDNLEKRTMLAALLSPDTDTDEVLDSVLALAEAEVLNRMYPFGYSDGTAVPTRYERIQVQLAAELYTKRGAEGQSGHTENGTTRTWPSESALLRSIVPMCGSVISNA